MSSVEFQVTGMSCGHCEAAIRDELDGIAGIATVDVSAETGRLVITGTDIDTAEVIAAVDEAGYQAVPR